jgi:hypothetical protein
MADKRLNDDSDKEVLAAAATAETVERKLRRRPKQLPVLALFLIIAVALAFYKLFIAA